jgi:hypothetical protein
MLIERQYCGLQRRYRFEQRYRDERHVVIRLELSAGGSEHDTLIGSRHEVGNLRQAHRMHRIDFARHHRRACLAWRQLQFTDSASWSGAEEHEIVRYFRERQCGSFHCGRKRCKRVHVLNGVEQVMTLSERVTRKFR